MGFDNTLFPTDISYNSVGGPGFSTKQIELHGGGFENVSQWATARHKYDVKYGVRAFDDILVVKQFHLARLGGKQSFLFKDWQDYATNSTSVLYRPTDPSVDGSDQPMQDSGGLLAIGKGDGAKTEFQLVKEYSDTVLNYVRTITKPKSGSLLVTVGGTLKTEGTDYTVNYTTGMVTFTTAPGNNVSVQWGGEYYVEVLFDPATDEWLATTIQDYSNGSIQSIGLIEAKSTASSYERLFYGGAINHGQQTGTTLNITQTQGLFHDVDPQDANVVIKLPDATDLPLGGPLFVIRNSSSTNTVAIQNSAGTDIITGGLPKGVVAQVYLSMDMSGNKVYIATGS